jgi:hypothetical protein
MDPRYLVQYAVRISFDYDVLSQVKTMRRMILTMQGLFQDVMFELVTC